MKLPFLNILARWLGYVPKQVGRRDFSGALQSRLTSDWNATSSTADNEIRQGLKPMRDRCRDLERNSPHSRRYLKLLKNNVLGANGIGLQMKVQDGKTVAGKWVAGLDSMANDLIETAWNKWSRAEFCDISKHLSLSDMEDVGLGSTARDGAVLFRKHYPRDNPFGFALEPIESDHLDINHNAAGGGGVGYIRLGVEYNALSQVIAYHILRNHPGELYQITPTGMWRERVPAEEIIHLYRPERFGQGTGFPWLASAILPMNNLDRYNEAEVVASRVAAAKMGIWVKQVNGPVQEYSGQKDATGNRLMEVAPGTFEMAPEGYDLKNFDPTHPNAIFPEFIKAQLRAISSGLGVSYTSLANDLEGVNFSSIRAGLLEEREEWKAIQRWFIDWFMRPVFEEWLMAALGKGAITNGTVTLPLSKFDKFNAPEFKARRWPWVDPYKDMQASVLGIEKGLTSRQAVIAEAGGDVEDVFRDQKEDNDMAKEYSLDFPKDIQPAAPKNMPVDPKAI